MDIYTLGIVVVAILVLLLIFKLLRKPFKLAVKLLIHVISGWIFLFFVNWIPGVDIEVTLISALIAGAFGIPGVLFLIFFF